MRSRLFAFVLVALFVMVLLVVDVGWRPFHVLAPPVGDESQQSPDEEGGPDDFLPGERELLVVIDGVVELERWGGMGLDPNDLLQPDQPLIPPVDGSPVDCPVQRCGCGVVGCAGLTFTIRRVGGRIEWANARESSVPQEIGPFSFDAEAYEREVQRAHLERPWESRADHVVRLVVDAFRHRRGARPSSFDWASLHEDGVLVSMTSWRPNPRAGLSVREPFPDDEGGWIEEIEPDESFVQHLGVFLIPLGVDAGEAARHVIAEIDASDPRTWRAPGT